MKLNTKRTVLTGLAFMSICSFWQLYNPVIPKILKNTYNMPETLQGFIMALDNILAVFLLPIFGMLSDKCSTKIGKRMPFIIVGTILSAILMFVLPIADFTKNLYLFVTTLCLLLISMGLYRSPAVSLMSDITPKPLRSKANAIINLMGAIGSVFTLILLKFAISTYSDGRENYSTIFHIVAIFMIASIAILFLSIKENKMAINDIYEDEKQEKSSNKLNKDEKFNLILILISVFFWFVGYNAVETNFSKFAEVKWQSSTAQAATCLLIASLGAIISYIPVGVIATKIGRKRTIQIGIIILSLCFLSAGMLKNFSIIFFILFLLVGMSWAFINVNSLPMVVEICKSSDIGKFTGYYYTFSMLAQIITPILCGILLDKIGYSVLMPYGAIAVFISFFTISKTTMGDTL